MEGQTDDSMMSIATQHVQYDWQKRWHNYCKWTKLTRDWFLIMSTAMTLSSASNGRQRWL